MTHTKKHFTHRVQFRQSMHFSKCVFLGLGYLFSSLTYLQQALLTSVVCQSRGFNFRDKTFRWRVRRPSNHSASKMCFQSQAPRLPTLSSRRLSHTAGTVPWQSRISMRTSSCRTRGTSLARQTAPVLCTPVMASNHTQAREHAMTPPLAPTKNR